MRLAQAGLQGLAGIVDPGGDELVQLAPARRSASASNWVSLSGAIDLVAERRAHAAA